MTEAVEILLATYNGEKFLPEQLDSILKQTNQNFRILIRDDHSQDSTVGIIKKYAEKHPDKIFLSLSEKNNGPISSFSYLLEQATAPYIMFSDQDDVWFEDKIEKTLKAMKQQESQTSSETPLLVHSDLQVVNAQLKLIDKSYWNFANLAPIKQNSLNRMITQNVVTGCTVMVNRSLAILASPIPQGVMMHDWWLALVAIAFGKIEQINAPTMLYRQHNRNVLGAQKFGSFCYLTKKLQELNQDDDGKLQQTSMFLKKYHGKLSEFQKLSLLTYLRLKKTSCLKRKFLILKHQFYKNGWLRNVVAFMLKDLP